MTLVKVKPLKGRRMSLDVSGFSGPSASQLARITLEQIGREATPAEILHHLLVIQSVSLRPDIGDLNHVLHRRSDLFEPGDQPGTWRLRPD